MVFIGCSGLRKCGSLPLAVMTFDGGAVLSRRPLSCPLGSRLLGRLRFEEKGHSSARCCVSPAEFCCSLQSSNVCGKAPFPVRVREKQGRSTVRASPRSSVRWPLFGSWLWAGGVCRRQFLKERRVALRGWRVCCAGEENSGAIE